MYYAYRTQQEDDDNSPADPANTKNGCFFATVTSSPGAGAYSAIKLGTGDYVVWEVGSIAAGALVCSVAVAGQWQSTHHHGMTAAAKVLPAISSMPLLATSLRLADRTEC
jgi:hypothetical protein